MSIFDLQAIVIRIPALVVGLSFHEFAHAWMANRLGDPTPRMYGRLTLEPWAHMDLMGTLMLLVFRFGWAKPVPVNPYNLRRPRQGMLKVALAGPVASLIVAALFLLVARLTSILRVPFLRDILGTGFSLNVGLAVFNLLPIPPLDGSRVLEGLVPASVASFMDRMQTYGPLILVLLVSSRLLDGFLLVAIGWIGTLVARIVEILTWFVPW